jgi:hypothetical protein
MKKISVFAIFVAILLGCNTAEKQAETPANDTTVAAPVEPPVADTTIDEGKLLGSWVRTDSPYELRILEVHSDGTALAGYFNPQSINVGQAKWSAVQGLRLYVELRDENYPGSNYLLEYLPDQDIMAGKYFQAVEGVTYDVAFARKK